MIAKLRRRTVLGGAAFSVLMATTVLACKLPVFRYALERWSADRYRMVAIINGPTDQRVTDAIAEMNRLGDSHANVDVETIDLSKLSDEELWQVEELEDESGVPLLQVFYPTRDGRRKLCWSGDLTADAVLRWRASGVRERLVADITSGVSAVWILVDGADPSENDRIAAELQTALAQASETIAVPEGVIAMDEATEYLRDHPSASMDDVLRCDIPLKIDFTFHRLKLDDEEELALRAIVAGWDERGAADAKRAIVFPVFGRGRMIEPLAARAFSQEAVVAACKYMVGECSCTVKSLNPGVDLLLDADWQGQVGDTVLVVDQSLPTAPVLVPIPAGPIELGEATHLGEADELIVAQNETPTPKRLMLALGVGVVLLVVVGGVWRISGRQT